MLSGAIQNRVGCKTVIGGTEEMFTAFTCECVIIRNTSTMNERVEFH